LQDQVWTGAKELAGSLSIIGSLNGWPGNARTHDLPAIRESLRVHGQYRAIVVQKSTRQIVAGNGTWEAAKAEGWTHIATLISDLTDEQARRIVLVDNRTNDLAGYDTGALIELLNSLPTLEGTGFSTDQLNDLLKSVADPTPQADETNALHSAWVIVVTCRDEMQQTELLDRFAGEGLDCRAVVS
jgi:hypothetical protein